MNKEVDKSRCWMHVMTPTDGKGLREGGSRESFLVKKEGSRPKNFHHQQNQVFFSKMGGSWPCEERSTVSLSSSRHVYVRVQKGKFLYCSR